MMIKKNDYNSNNFLQFSPYIIFCITYIALYGYNIYLNNSHQNIIYRFQELHLCAAFIAIIQAFFTYKEKLTLDKKIDQFMILFADSSIIYNCFIIIYLAIFNHIMAKTNAIVTLVTLVLLYLPAQYILTILFFIASICSIVIQNISVTAIILLPIGYSIGLSYHSNIALVAATIISGILCGNLIATYLHTFNFNLKQSIKHFLYKLTATFWPIIIPLAGTIVLLLQHPCKPISTTIYTHLQNSVHTSNYLTLLPYIIFICIRFYQIDLCFSLITGSCSALFLQIIMNKITCFDALSTFFYGFHTQNIFVNILLSSIFMIGLVKIIRYNNGFDWVLEKITKYFYQKKYYHILQSIILTITQSLLIIIDSKKNIQIDHNLLEKNNVKVISIITTNIQAMLPYGSILLLTIHTYRCSYIDIIHYMIYPILATITVIIASIHNNFALEAK